MKPFPFSYISFTRVLLFPNRKERGEGGGEEEEEEEEEKEAVSHHRIPRNYIPSRLSPFSPSPLFFFSFAIFLGVVVPLPLFSLFVGGFNYCPEKGKGIMEENISFFLFFPIARFGGGA